MKNWASTLRLRAFAPIDPASIGLFRIVFGSCVAWHVWSLNSLGGVQFWTQPRMLFKYYGFSWVHRFPEPVLHPLWIAVGVLAVLVALGLLYRLSALLLFLSFTYFFLLDESKFLNHTYLVCLFSFLLIFVPAHRAFSIDAWLARKKRATTAPAWSLWLLRAQIGVVYFFGGVAKIAPDWLAGEPMRGRLAAVSNFPVIGKYFTHDWFVYSVSYGSMLFDLCVVPLLLWRRTRIPAFLVAVAFHVINSRWFDIEFFPWMALAATALFFTPDWPRRFLGRWLPFRTGESPEATPPEWRKTLTLAFVAVYLAIQFLVPLRHFLWRGGPEWTYAEHRFSWRMMLLNIRLRAFFYVTDPNTGRTITVSNLRPFLTPRQYSMLAYLPDYPLQFAHFLATENPPHGLQPTQVEARIYVSINGRKPQLYLDPNVDLAAEKRTLGRPRWLRTITEPLPDHSSESQDDLESSIFD